MVALCALAVVPQPRCVSSSDHKRPCACQRSCCVSVRVECTPRPYNARWVPSLRPIDRPVGVPRVLGVNCRFPHREAARRASQSLAHPSSVWYPRRRPRTSMPCAGATAAAADMLRHAALEPAAAALVFSGFNVLNGFAGFNDVFNCSVAAASDAGRARAAAAAPPPAVAAAAVATAALTAARRIVRFGPRKRRPLQRHAHAEGQ